MAKYKAFALAFSYPTRETLPEGVDLATVEKEYDRLFRREQIWLYLAEYFPSSQKDQILFEIGGFYKAFGVEPQKDRLDSLAQTSEFLYYLLFKALYAREKQLENWEEKWQVCQEAYQKFFQEYFSKGAEQIARQILQAQPISFYQEAAQELLKFLEEESSLWKGETP